MGLQSEELKRMVLIELACEAFTEVGAQMIKDMKKLKKRLTELEKKFKE